jgi:transcriptional regulator with XRE-family HTH domain
MGVVEMGQFLREKRGDMTQEQLEELTGVSQGMISRLERGAIQRPNMEFLKAIAGALDVAYEDFIAALYTRDLNARPYGSESGDSVPAALANIGGKFRDLTPEELKSVEDFAEYVRSKRDKS